MSRWALSSFVAGSSTADLVFAAAAAAADLVAAANEVASASLAVR